VKIDEPIQEMEVKYNEEQETKPGLTKLQRILKENINFEDIPTSNFKAQQRKMLLNIFMEIKEVMCGVIIAKLLLYRRPSHMQAKTRYSAIY